jgi:hypothetical protein
MSNLIRYIDYFRQLAVTHKDILHKPSTETADSAIGEKRFAKWSAEEVVSGLRTKIGPVALMIEIYETDLYASNVYDIKQLPKGAFTFFKATKEKDVNDQYDAFEWTEKIVYDLLKQIWQDHYGTDKNKCSTPFKKFVFDKDMITAVGPLFKNNYCGWRVEFEFEFQQEFNITIAPADGTFIQQQS